MTITGFYTIFYTCYLGRGDKGERGSENSLIPTIDKTADVCVCVSNVIDRLKEIWTRQQLGNTRDCTAKIRRLLLAVYDCRIPWSLKSFKNVKNDFIGFRNCLADAIFAAHFFAQWTVNLGSFSTRSLFSTGHQGFCQHHQVRLDSSGFP